jgi:lipopolysaccharide/colanic/teichoic acid biosynthesis glycosyltransferase
MYQERNLKFLKRFFDLIFSLIFLILLLPVLFIIALFIKIDSKGPVFFKQDRLTLNGKVFTIYKFRTMVENAEKMGTGLFSYDGDSRITRVGQFLRKTSLDEIPQLINIIIGNMSIVGPRPPVSYELGDYKDLNDEYKKRFTVLPGVTGLAQVIGRNELPWEEKVKYDNQYIEKFKKYGIFLDIKIIFLTFARVFNKTDIVEARNEKFANLSDEEIAKKTAEEIAIKAKKI